MTQPALRLVHPDTGEIVEPAEAQEWRERYDEAKKLLAEKDSQNVALAKINAQQEAKIRRYEGEFADRATRDPKHVEIRDVLLYHRERFLSPRAKIVPDSDGWNKVRDLLTILDVEGEPAFTAETLCESVDGALLDDWYQGASWKRRAETMFRNPSTVQRNLERLEHARGNGKHEFWALPFPAEAVYWLSEECQCGHARAQHVVQTDGGCCAVGDVACRCERFVGWGERIARWREAQK